MTRIQHIIPLRGVVKGPKDDTADQVQIPLGQGGRKDRGVFGHIADWPQFDTFVTCARALIQNRLPGRVGRVAGKFDAP